MIPSELVLDSTPWTVVDCDTLDDDIYAQTDKAHCVIRLATDQSPAMKESAFWHELIHALFSVRDFKLRAKNPRDAEEEVATLLGPALHAFFQQNADIAWKYDVPEINQ